MVKLTPRLQTIADLVPSGITVADIGTDHGYVPAWLVLHERCPSAWATDLQQGPLENARDTLERYGLSDDITLLLGPGLRPLRGTAPEGLIIAGMGGMLITEILEADLEIARAARCLILQPMVGQAELRRWLVTHGFRILHERLAQEGEKLYEVIVAASGTAQRQDPLKDLIGYVLPEEGDPLFGVFLDKQIRKQEKIIAEAGRSARAGALVEQCGQWVKALKEVRDAHQL